MRRGAAVLALMVFAAAGSARAAKPAAPPRPSAAGYRYLGEGSGFVAWEKGGRVWKVLKFKNRYTDTTTVHDPRREMIVHEQVTGHALLASNARFARRWGHVQIPVAERTRRPGVIVMDLVDTGHDFRSLSPKARRTARRQIAKITDDAAAALEGGFVTDTARSNFRFSPKGKIVAWFDPIHATAFRWQPTFGRGGAVELVLRRFGDADQHASSDADEVGRVRATGLTELALLPAYQ